MSDALDIRVKDIRIGIANVEGRLPFKFGNAVVKYVAQATVEALVETRDGRTARGYAGDFLSYAWFDKTPGKDPAQGSRELLEAIQIAGAAWMDAGFGSAFGLWRDLHPGLEAASVARGQNKLSGSFGISMIERAVLDATGHLTGLGFHDLIRSPALGVEEGSVFADLAQGSLAAALPDKPATRIDLRHTVGMIDPLTAADNIDPVGDGLPETLEDYMQTQGLRRLKIKISGDADASVARLEAIAALMETAPHPVQVTVDGNEQFTDVDSFVAVADAIRRNPKLEKFWQSILFYEQPVERNAALAQSLSAEAQAAIGKPMIIDESDGYTTAFAEAMELGYSGVSHKNCKGVFRSFLNNALAAGRNTALGEQRYFLSAEDLTCLPLVCLNADLAAAASLGISHIERNGHHYFRGLDHLSEAEQASAALYGGLYRQTADGWALAVTDGALDASGLTGPGFGLRQPPDMDRLQPPETWRFDA